MGPPKKHIKRRGEVMKRNTDERQRKEMERRRQLPRNIEDPQPTATASTSTSLHQTPAGQSPHPTTPADQASSSTPDVSLSVVSSAKKRKMLTVPKEELNVPGKKEYVILEKGDLEEAATGVSCTKCSGPVTVRFTQRYLDCKLKLQCSNCDVERKEQLNETPVTDMLVYSNMESGSGYIGFHKLLGNMSMRPLYNRYFQRSQVVTDAALEKAASVLESSLCAIRKYYSEQLKVTPDEDGVLDIRVIFDGSWQKRGHTSLLSVGVLVEAETGLVIDYESVCKYCEMCSKKECSLKRKKLTRGQYDEWLAEHVCQKNYSGSSGGMEAHAAVTLFGRSLAKNLRYTVFISDGDSSAYTAVCKMNDGVGPYGDMKVQKGECINHVSKRLGTALRKLRDEVVTEKTTRTGKVRRMRDMGGGGKES